MCEKIDLFQMGIHLFSLYLCLFLPLIDCRCLSRSSTTWTCDGRQNGTELVDYESILNQEQFENLFLSNYQLSTFRIDHYPSTLRLFDASGNSFSSFIITPRHRYRSNLRQLILQSNRLTQLNAKQIFFPTTLERISLANNRLQVLDARMFTGLENLTDLDLSNNLLKRILPHLVLQFNVRLYSNPLDCRCAPEFYRIICERATSVKPSKVASNDCMAPYYNPRLDQASPLPYLRFSTFTLTCPISSQPPPLIIWSTPFGRLTATNSSSLDLVPMNIDETLYITLTAVVGPLTTRTRHTLHAFDNNRLSVTRARSALDHRFSCTGINMLGNYTYHFDFIVDTKVRPRALWQMIYTLAFGVFMSLVGGALCLTLRRTNYYPVDQLKTPPIYPTMTPNSASRTPPNFELNQWLSVAAANISGTLEQVRDKLRLGVQQVSESMGQKMGRASELFTHGVQQAGGSIRQAAETSAAYLQSFRETSQHRLNTMRVQTLSSLRNSGQIMRTGMNIFTTQVNSLRDYCGVTTGIPLTTNYLLQQQQQQQPYHSTYSPTSMSYLNHHQITTIAEDDESAVETSSFLDPSPYAGHIVSTILADSSGIGQLDAASNSVLAAMNNFQEPAPQTFDTGNVITEGCVSAGIGTFHGRIYEQGEELVNEPERLIMYGHQRPAH